MRRSLAGLAGLLTVSGLLAGCTLPAPAFMAPRPTGDPISVGAVLSLTGSQANAGQMAKEGYLFCQDWINGKGGVTVNGVGRPLSIDIADDQSRPSIATTATTDLIERNHDRLLLGGTNDATAARAATVADQHQVPMVSSGASSDSILNSGYHWFFTVLTPRTRQLLGVIDMALTQNPRPQSVAILYSSDNLSAEIAHATADYATSKGLTVVFGASYTLGVNDFTSELLPAASNSPDLFLEAGHLRESVRTIQQAEWIHFQPKLLAFSDGPGRQDFTGVLKKSANYAVGTTQWSPSTRNHVSYFLDSFHYSLAFQSQFGHLPDENAAAATAACLTLEVAMERANSTVARWVRDALAITDMRTFFGAIKFDERGANAVKPLYVEQIQSGHPVLIWPPELATARPRYPDPGWAKH